MSIAEERTDTASWTEQTIETWDQFDTEVLAPHVAATTPLALTYAYRGQSSAAWTLCPSMTRLCRNLGVDRAHGIKIERRLLQRFMERSHMFLDAKVLPAGFGTPLTTEASLDWWTLIQHYGGPTRLLDWTRSPLVGLYFAVRRRWDTDGALWTVHIGELNMRGIRVFGAHPKTDAERWRSENPDARVFMVDRERPTDRMIVQQGAFSIGSDILADHADTIAHVLPASEGGAILRRKLVIPANAKPSFLRQLHHMNVTAAALFPGLDGLGGELDEIARLQ